MVHCHNEYDLPTAKAMARAVEGIEPKWFEDPLPPPFSDSWVALKRECRVPLLTGEKCEMPQGFYPFLKEQAVDYIYPDIAFCGGITGFMKIANLSGAFPHPSGDAQRGRDLAHHVMHPRRPLGHGLPDE